jgi:hypothetical protein
LRNQGISGVASCVLVTTTITQFTVMDLIIDAHITWNSVVSNNTNLQDHSIGNKFGRGLISAEFFPTLHLNMISAAGISHKHKMKLQLLTLFEKLQ